MTREQKVTKWVKLWQKRWLLDHWEIVTTFESVNYSGGDDTVATCSANPRYLKAHIRIWKPFWDEDVTEAERSAAICHEIAHIHTWSLAALTTRVMNGLVVTQNELDNADESATEQLAKALFRAYQ